MSLDIKVSPENLISDWGNFEDWENGVSSPPTEYLLSGTGASIARESVNIKEGLYSAKVTFGSADVELYRDLQIIFGQHKPPILYKGRRFTYGVWVKTSVANQVKIKLDDGVGVSESAYHTGSGNWEFLTVTRDMDENATRFRIINFVDTNGVAYFDGSILCEGEILFTYLSGININVDRWRANNTFSVTDFDISRRPGKKVMDTKLLGKDLSLSGDVFGNTIDEAKGYIDVLKKAFFRGKKDLFFYDTRIVKGFLEAFNYEPVRATTMINFDLRFGLDDNPVSQYFNKKRFVQAVSSSPVVFTIVNNGTVEATPIFLFIASGGNITAITLENLTTGELFSYTGVVSSGNILIIDTEVLTVENNSVDDLALFSNGDFIKLALGTNKFKFTGSNCTIKVDYFERFL